MKKKITLKRIFHRDNWRIAIFFDFDKKLKSVVRSINGSTYSSTHKCFYVDDTEENLKLILRTLRDIADIDITALSSGREESADNMVP
jgi:integrase/recombinase XerD